MADFSTLNLFPYRTGGRILKLPYNAFFLNPGTILVVCAVSGLVIGIYSIESERDKLWELINEYFKTVSEEGWLDRFKRLRRLLIELITKIGFFTAINLLWFVIFGFGLGKYAYLIYLGQVFLPGIRTLKRLHIIIPVCLKWIRGFCRQRFNPIDVAEYEKQQSEYWKEILYESSDLPGFWGPVCFWMGGFYMFFTGLPSILKNLKISDCGYSHLASTVFFLAIHVGRECKEYSKTVSRYLAQLLWLIFSAYIRFGAIISVYNNSLFRRTFNTLCIKMQTRPSTTTAMANWLIDRLCKHLETFINEALPMKVEEDQNSSQLRIGPPQPASNSEKIQTLAVMLSKIVENASPSVKYEYGLQNIKLSSELPYSTVIPDVEIYPKNQTINSDVNRNTINLTN